VSYNACQPRAAIYFDTGPEGSEEIGVLTGRNTKQISLSYKRWVYKTPTTRGTNTRRGSNKAQEATANSFGSFWARCFWKELSESESEPATMFLTQPPRGRNWATESPEKFLVYLGRDTRTSTQSRGLVRRNDASWYLNCTFSGA